MQTLSKTASECRNVIQEHITKNSKARMHEYQTLDTKRHCRGSYWHHRKDLVRPVSKEPQKCRKYVWQEIHLQQTKLSEDNE